MHQCVNSLWPIKVKREAEWERPFVELPVIADLIYTHWMLLLPISHPVLLYIGEGILDCKVAVSTSWF